MFMIDGYVIAGFFHGTVTSSKGFKKVVFGNKQQQRHQLFVANIFNIPFFSQCQ